jgi:septal ring factor EnvC (AmiA/AmiB activator)
MSSNDQTLNDVITKPTLETVLERINAVAGSIAELRTDMDQRFDAVDGEIAKLRADVDQRFEAVNGEIAGLRKDTERGFRSIERQIGYLAKDFLERRAEIGDLLERVEELEKKAS